MMLVLNGYEKQYENFHLTANPKKTAFGLGIFGYVDKSGQTKHIFLNIPSGECNLHYYFVCFVNDVLEKYKIESIEELVVCTSDKLLTLMNNSLFENEPEKLAILNKSGACFKITKDEDIKQAFVKELEKSIRLCIDKYNLDDAESIKEKERQSRALENIDKVDIFLDKLHFIIEHSDKVELKLQLQTKIDQVFGKTTFENRIY